MTPTDEQHLRLLSIFHYVLAALRMLLGFLPLVIVAFMLVPMLAESRHGGPPAVFFVIFGGIMLVVVLVGVAMAAMMALAGWYLGQRRHHTFCFVVACIECIWTPFGTVLGVLTILVLLRPEVKAAFDSAATGTV